MTDTLTTPIQLAVFDLAGTTIDDRDEVYRVLRASVEREGAQFSDEEFQQWMGTEKQWAIRNLLTIGGIEASDERVKACFQWFREELGRVYREEPPTPMPEIIQAFRSLRTKGIKVGLTTGFSRDITDIILDALQWTSGSGEDAVVDTSVAGDEVPNGRPAPDMIQAVMRATGIDNPDAVISLGDTVVDIQAAKAAKVHSAGVLTGHLSAEDFAAEQATFILDKAADVVDVLPAQDSAQA
ncbi:HAD hydrolase-like protein [Corynebacterium pelargi]|uniref:Phosphonoacetaldehyde hydrolase n=1 Tax=Corynebacterium pelargi TaxID=1471400 RepID=A0A410WAT5_9CORY|nr:HAD hydrolase-like protein [Corynebacterium pelargi]QAU53093.1 Phosphonoacetaldehyde hydrolase [Corynebacterium pelargi]GGG74917.1 phosphonoacetaldehyde hydrolase [Corynebacterium pelargi]